MAQEIADSKLLDTWGSSGTKIEPDISKIIEGWQLGEQPPHEYMNWLQNTFGSKLNHILKNGVATWNNETEYLAGASVQHNGSVWLCKTTNTNSEPTELNANWEKVAINKDLTVTVGTLADLRSISYPANTVWASGYHAKNDGAFGSHIFRLKGIKTTETDNGGTVIITTIGGTDYVYELQYDGAVNVNWFGAKGDAVFDSINNVYTGTDNYNILQNLLILAKINNWSIDFDNGKYLISQGLILPFGNYQQSISTIINGNGATLVGNVSTASINGSSITAISTGYLDNNNVLHITSGDDLHITSNVIMQNFNFSHFGRAIYARNMNFGSGISNIVAYNCFNGVMLERCFYLKIDNIFLNGMSRAIGSIGFSIEEYSNVIDNSGIKVRDFDIGIKIGGADGCKFTTISAEANNYGVVLSYECSTLEIDCGYLEGNTVANLDIRAVIRKGTVRNLWFYGNPNNNIKMINDAGIYANVDLVNNNFVSGLTSSSPIKNIFGRITTLASSVINANVISSNFPNLVFDSESYNINTSSTGYQSLINAIKKETSGQGIVPTYFSGCHANGVNNGNRAYNQTVTVDGNSLVFDTEFDYVVTTFLSWTVAIAHSTGTIIGNFLIMADVNGLDFNSCTFKGYSSQSGAMYPSSLFTVSNNNGKIRITTSPFASSTLYHSYLRLI